MLASSLIRAITTRGGTAELRDRGTNHRGDDLGHEVVGELNGYDVHMYASTGYGTDKLTGGHFTVRPVAKRGYHDPLSDYNPGGYAFLHKLKHLDNYCRKVAL